MSWLEETAVGREGEMVELHLERTVTDQPLELGWTLEPITAEPDDLAETEGQLRGGDLPPRLALEILVVGLMPGRDSVYG